MIFEESDQAGIIGDLFTLHLQSKGHTDGKPNPECPFCKGFIISDRKPGERALQSYKFIIMDVSNTDSPPSNTSFVYTVPDSHFWTDIDMLRRQLSVYKAKYGPGETLDLINYIDKGLENTKQQGYDLKREELTPGQLSTPETAIPPVNYSIKFKEDYTGPRPNLDKLLLLEPKKTQYNLQQATKVNKAHPTEVPTEEYLNRIGYFTPSIEDIRVGYECEFTGWLSGYKEVKVTQDNLSLAVGNLAFLKVPYLTKEQIEAEQGWDKLWDNVEIYCKRVNRNLYYLDRLDNNIIKISHIKDPREGSMNVIYIGECKDINTFRYICKLLNIQ